MRAIIQFRDVYGERKAYPVNDTAKLLAELAGTKTLTLQALSVAQRLGIEIVQRPLSDFEADSS